MAKNMVTQTDPASDWPTEQESDTRLSAKLDRASLVWRIKFCLFVIVVGLVVSGLTAFPLETEILWLTKVLGVKDGAEGVAQGGLHGWLAKVRDGLVATNRDYPFLAYGTDWLAFAHLAIAASFIGPWIDPVRNKWTITFGLICCAGVIPLALVAGPIRGIPWYWQILDCSFGIFGAIPLLLCRRYIDQLERITS